MSWIELYGSLFKEENGKANVTSQIQGHFFIARQKNHLLYNNSSRIIFRGCKITRLYIIVHMYKEPVQIVDILILIPSGQNSRKSSL